MCLPSIITYHLSVSLFLGPGRRACTVFLSPGYLSLPVLCNCYARVLMHLQGWRPRNDRTFVGRPAPPPVRVAFSSSLTIDPIASPDYPIERRPQT